MAAKTSKAVVETRKPVVIVDNAHINYKVYGTGRQVTGRLAKGGLLTKKVRYREVHAIKGVSFTIYEGETVGIIGSNGSGKSSLMRAIAGLTSLRSGSVFAFARPTLLGVGAVLLPALSGEKNIVLGGLAMGYSRKEITDKVPEITEFAGISEFIELPMRTYSSGMSARLRFAIAASKIHDILIVDEALSVGDQNFRTKSEARMREMRDQAGTVFLVSHSMKSILDTCTRVIWIEKGVLMGDGDPQKVIDAYNKHNDSSTID